MLACQGANTNTAYRFGIGPLIKIDGRWRLLHDPATYGWICDSDALQGTSIKDEPRPFSSSLSLMKSFFDLGLIVMCIVKKIAPLGEIVMGISRAVEP